MCALLCDSWVGTAPQATDEVMQDAQEVGSTRASHKLDSGGDCHDLLAGL